MEDTGGLVCRYCGRPMAVPASRCPWCDRQIMVICAACKQYTDDERSTCEHCGAPLQPASREEIRRYVGVPAEVAELLADRDRAQLIASGVIATYLPGFLFDDGRRRTVLAELFGSLPERRRKASALIFGAIVYLVERGYCALRPLEGDSDDEWVEVHPWDGQARSLEARLAKQAGLGLNVGRAVDLAVCEEMGFDFEVVTAQRSPIPGAPRLSTVRDRSAMPGLTAVIEAGRLAVLPEHEEKSACATIYQMIVQFVRARPERARRLAQTIVDVLEWFEQYERNPSLALAR